MKHWKLYALACALAALISGPAVAQVDFSDDFESYTLHPGGDIGSIGDLGGGWLIFANVFNDFPGCSQYDRGYGVFPAPNSDAAFSGIVTGSDGQALNVFSDYNNVDDQNAGKCIEANVFQETVFNGADAGSYEFTFDTETPVQLGAGVSTYGFVKMLDPNNGYATVLFLTVDTAAAGSKTIPVDLDSSADGMILQWGFASTASNFLPSGRVYDNVTFAVPAPPPSYETVPSDVPTLSPLGLLALLLLVVATAGIVLNRRG